LVELVGCAQKLRLVLGVLLEHTLEVGGGDDGKLDAVVSDDTKECV
jgi:hypothetical protein